MSIRSAEQIIEDVVRVQFSKGAVSAVEVVRGRYDEDENTLHVLVVMDKQFKDADRQRMLGLVRHIRSELAEYGWDEFPIVDFISASDAAKIKREFA